jgi:hypothetical protein
MSERSESGEELVDESGRNPTQRRIDEEGQTGPVDASWTETPGEATDEDDVENEPSPHQGEEGQADDVA